MSGLTLGPIGPDGVLRAIVSTSTQYLRQLFAPQVRVVNGAPQRTIVHRAPHLDEYFAELLYRSAGVGNGMLPEFRELPLHSLTHDGPSEYYWPGAAVFGMGANSPQLRALPADLFDEHDTNTGRSAESCVAMVLTDRFSATPPAIAELVRETSRIDASGGSHSQHLGNAIKTIHNYRYSMGTDSQGGQVRRALDDHWKWALVNGLVAAVVWAIDHQFEFRTTETMLTMLDRFQTRNPLAGAPQMEQQLQRLRQILRNENGLAQQAVLDINGQQMRQQLLTPYAAAAAAEAWGEELAYFLVEPFIEAEAAGQISFQRIQSLINQAMQARPPEQIHESDVSIVPWIVRGVRLLGRKQRWGAHSAPARTRSNLWVLSCSSDGNLMKANQALGNYLTKNNDGVGLVLIENRSAGTKALFSGRFLHEDFFDAVVDRIREQEPGQWYRVQPTTRFILNGNAAHMYVPKSSLTHWSLDRICKDVFQRGRPAR